jgi:hypothetical protein
MILPRKEDPAEEQHLIMHRKMKIVFTASSNKAKLDFRY